MSSSESAERAVTRRRVLSSIAGGVAGLGTVGAVSGNVSAATPDVDRFADSKPRHVTIQYDEPWLNRYSPMLDLTAVRITNRPTLRGWRVSSSEWDTEVGVYACEYAVQRDVTTLTSHAGDHEWIYVFVDPDTGDVQSTSYTAYHWLRGYVLNPSVYQDGEGGRHPRFAVAPTYHNYAPLSSSDTPNAVLLETQTLGDNGTRSGPLYSWLKNGMAEDMEPGAVHHPWNLAPDGPLDAWWSEDGSGRTNRWIVNAWAFVGFTVGVGIRGSGNADLGDAQI